MLFDTFAQEKIPDTSYEARFVNARLEELKVCGSFSDVAGGYGKN